MPNYYEILGIQKTANDDEITKAYRKLTLLNHPDKKQETAEKKAAEEKFIQIKTAYETLIDPKERTKYDLTLKIPRSAAFNSRSSTSNFSYSTNPQKLTPLQSAVKRKNYEEVCAALNQQSDFKYVHQTTQYHINGKSCQINALEMAIIQGDVKIVKRLLDLNYNFNTPHFIRQNSIASINKLTTISIAFLYFNKEIIDLLMDKLDQQMQFDFLNEQSQLIEHRENKKTILTSSLIATMRYMPLNLLEKLEQFAEYGADIFDYHVLETFLNISPDNMKLFINKYGPGKIIHIFICNSNSPNNGLCNLKKILAMGYPFYIQDEQGNNFFHMIASRQNVNSEKKTISRTENHLLDLLEPLVVLSGSDAFKRFGELLATKNANGKYPEDLVVDNKLRELFQRFKKNLAASHKAQTTLTTHNNHASSLSSTTQNHSTLFKPVVAASTHMIENNKTNPQAKRKYSQTL